MPSRNYRHTGKTVLGLDVGTQELERFELEGGALRTTVAGGGVTVTNDADNPVPTNETPFESFTVSVYAVPVDPLFEGAIAWQGADDIECQGMLVFTPPDNVGEIYIGDSPTTCFTPFYPGTRATYPLPNLRALYAYAVSSDDQPQTLIVERYF